MTELQAIDVLTRLENIQKLLTAQFYFNVCLGFFILFATIFYIVKIFILD